jgi:hypothetical protein
MRFLSTDPRYPGVIGVGQEACGLFALGQSAHGIIAIGQLSRGVFVVGQLAIGVFAVGQGAIGLWHATGMVGLAGQRGYGLILHTLPRVVVAEPQPELPSTVALAEIAGGTISEGWVLARLVMKDGAPAVEPEDGDARVDVSAIFPMLAAALEQGRDRAAVRVRAMFVPDASSGYRSASAHVDLVASEAVPYRSRPPVHLAYPSMPKGEVKNAANAASTLALVWRSIVWLGALVFWWAIVGWPFMAKLLDWPNPF